jgi:hypothetical protein
VAGGVAGGPPHHRPLRRQAAHPSLARSLSSRVRPARCRRRRRATAMEKNRNVDVVGGRVGLGFGRTQVLRACPFMVEGRVVGMRACSFGLSATSQQYFSLRTNQPPAISQQYFSLTTNQPSAMSQTNMLLVCTWRAEWQVGLDLLWNLPSSSQRAADGQDPFACIYYC